MQKIIWDVIKASPAALAASFVVANSAIASEINQEMTSVASLESQQQDSMGQVTSVSQFSDVQPTDWAFQALQSLVERYGCIAGYPNGTYRGNRALTRYEFAAGLNACLDRVNELIATATADLVKKEDLAALQRLQEEFAAELATLRGRVDALEARTAELEANQFSTTTKLRGEVIFSVSDTFGEDRAIGSRTLINDVAGTARPTEQDSNTVFSDRVRLRLQSSFTGKDQLELRLQARNTASNAAVTGTQMTRLSYDGDNGNDVEIDKINYTFPLGDAIRVRVDANNGEFFGNVNNFNPDLASDGLGAIARYGRFSPIYRVGSGGAGATVTVGGKNSPLKAEFGYLAGGGSNRSSSPLDRDGLFDGNYAALAQIGYQVNDAIGLGLTYAHAYQNPTETVNGVTSGGGVNVTEGTGSDIARAPFGTGVATSANHYGLQANIRASKNIGIGGWVGFANAEAREATTGGVREGDNADIFYWAANLTFKDFGPKGSLLGFTFGQPPKVTGNDFRQTVAGRTIEQRDADTSYHLEALYRLRVNENVAITPGLLVIFNPEHNDRNDTIYVGTLRTTFTF